MRRLHWRLGDAMVYKVLMTDRIAAKTRPTHTRHWLIVVGAACLMTAGQFSFLSSSILNPGLAASLGVGLSEVMGFNSMQAVAGAIGMSFLAPILMRRIGVRSSIIVGGAWAALAMGAVAFVPNTAVLYALGLASGLTFGIATSMGASMLVNSWFEERRGTMMGVVFAVSGVGGIAAGLVMPSIVRAGGWQLGFLTLAGALVALVIVPGVFLIRSKPASLGLVPLGAREAPPEDATTAIVLPGVPAGRAFRTPQFAALTLGIVLIAMVLAVQQHFAPLMVEHGVELPAAGSLISLMALISVFSTIILGVLNDRHGTLTALLFALACLTLAMVGYVFSFGFVPLAASTAVFAFGAGFPGVVIPILVMLLFGMRDYAAILGPSMAMIAVGFAIGTPLWGAVLDATGSYSAALVGAAILSVAAAALLAWAIRTAPGLRNRIERELSQEPLES